MKKNQTKDPEIFRENVLSMAKDNIEYACENEANYLKYPIDSLQKGLQA